MDHGGTPEEREALNSAIRGLKLLAKERTGEPEGCALREPVYGMHNLAVCRQRVLKFTST